MNDVMTAGVTCFRHEYVEMHVVATRAGDKTAGGVEKRYRILWMEIEFCCEPVRMKTDQNQF